MSPDTMPLAGETDRLVRTIDTAGFAFAPAPVMQAVLGEHGSLADWDAFAASWGDLGVDTYMADGGRYRKRRHATFAATETEPEIVRGAHRPHHQSRDYNPLNGGIQRWFEPVTPAVSDGPTMTTILRTCRDLFEQLGTIRSWHIEVHQFRIEAQPGVEGRPTPEGMHRDGVDFVLVLLIRRENVRSGVTSIGSPDGRMLGTFTLVEPMDAALTNDLRVLHGATPIEPLDPGAPSFRDVLVVTFRHA